MNKYTSIDIKELKFCETAKDVLLRTLIVASSETETVKRTVKDLLVICPDDARVSQYAKIYEKIITENRVYGVTGKGTYLELAFPREGTEKDYVAFYESARLVAATINSFKGVFLISFEQFEGYNDLTRSAGFGGLLKYIDKNNVNTSFVFHVLPEFMDIGRLVENLRGHVNLLEVSLDKPDMQEAINYIIEQLENSRIELTNSARERLMSIFIDKLDITSKSYLGYATLERIAQSIVYKIVSSCSENKRGYRKIDVEGIEFISDCIDFPAPKTPVSHRLGFL